MRAKKSWNVLSLLEWTTQYFRKNSIDNPRLDAELLLAYNLKLNRMGLYLNYDRPLMEEELSSFKELVKMRVKREPLQYITGVQEFWSLEFKVSPGVLVPRPETELLVEEALKAAGGRTPVNRKSSTTETGSSNLTSGHLSEDLEGRPLILDLCTGCGCIAIALAKELKYSKIYATDSSEKALGIAYQNALKHDVKDRVTFLKGNLFKPLEDLDWGVKFDTIISNPPYIKQSDLEGLEPEVKDYEPLSALDGGVDGLDFIRTIIDEAPNYLKNNGWLLLEIAFDQARGVESLIEGKGAYSPAAIIKDYSGNDRVVKARVYG